MKKFNFKTILICVLALVLVFALVACNDGGGNSNKPNKPTNPNNPNNPNNPTKPGKPADNSITTEEFFSTLWDNASAIGSDVAIGKTDDVKLSVDLDVEAGVKSRSSKKPVNSLELGVALDVVLDRSSGTTENTAAKVALHLGDANILTLYYFVKDCNYLYLDFGGQQIKADIKLNDVNSQIKDVIKHYVIDTPISVKGDTYKKINGKTPSEIIDMFVGDMGPDWSLNALIGNVTTLFNLNLQELIAKNGTVSGILGLLVGNVNDLFDSNGNLSVDKVLSNKTIGELFLSTKTEIDGGNHYSTRISSDPTFDLIGGFISLKGILGEGGLLDKNASVGFDYDIINGALANFTIAADLAGMSIGTSGYPYVAVHINHLNFRKGNAAAETLGISKASYKEEVAVELTEKLSFTGLTVDASKLGEAGINAAPKDIEVGLKATVGINDNAKTNANLWVSYGGSNIIEASYIGAQKQLAVRLHRDVYINSDTGSVLDLIVKYAGKPIVDGLCAKMPGSAEYIRAFADQLFKDNKYDTLKDDVVGAVWNNLDAAGMLKEKVLDVYMGKDFSLIELIEHPASKGYPSASSSADVVVSGINMTQLLNAVFGIATFDGGKISINSKDAIADAAKFAQMFAASSAPEGGWTKANLIKLVKDEIKKAFANDPTGYRKWVVNIAQAIKMGNKSYTGTDADEALNYLVDNVFDALELNLDLDFTQGMALTLEVSFSGASIKLEHNLTAYPTTGSTYKNYADSTSTAENGWIVY